MATAARWASRLLLAVAVCAVAASAATTDRPIIGVLTVDIAENSACGTFAAEQANAGAGGCFTVYYVKWIEAAGGRVVPIPFNAPKPTLDKLFDSVNGILFTGGGLSLLANTTYYQTARYLFNRVLEANAKGDYMPLWGTCMGFQLMHIITANDESVLQRYAFDSEEISWPLELQPAARSSRLLGPQAPADVVSILGTQAVTSNLHHDGITPEDFAARPSLTSFFDILSLNHDRKGKAFVSTVEAKKWPIYGAQWHPERPQFEWGTADLGINHGAAAVRAMQYCGEFFVFEARRNTHHFASAAEEQAALIYNWSPVAIGDQLQAYFF